MRRKLNPDTQFIKVIKKKNKLSRQVKELNQANLNFQGHKNCFSFKFSILIPLLYEHADVRCINTAVWVRHQRMKVKSLLPNSRDFIPISMYGIAGSHVVLFSADQCRLSFYNIQQVFD